MGVAGLESLFSPGMIFSFIGSAFKTIIASNAAEQQNQLYETQLAQQKAAAAQRAADQAKQLNRTIAQQAVIATARGIQGGSSVFRQVSQQSFDVYHEDVERDRLNLSMQETAIKSKMAATRAQEWGDITSAWTPFINRGAGYFLEQTPENYFDKYFGEDLYG